MKKLFLTIALCVFSLTSTAEGFKAASDIWSPFFMVSSNGYSGIGVEVLNEVVRRSGDKVSFHSMPTKRAHVMLDNNDVDLMVLDSPFWNSDYQMKTIIFTDDIMSVQEYIYLLQENDITITTPSDLKGKTVNILRGYSYPLVNHEFKEGLFHYQKVDNETSLIKTLLLNRADAIFMDSVAFQYSISIMGHDNALFSRGMQLSNATLGIKIRKEKNHILPRFNKAIADMKKDGTIDNIISKYTKGFSVQ